jgi:hypothetical protein
MPRVLQILFGLLLLTGVAGCSQLTQENYDRLKMGMSYPEVVKLLGEPDRCDATLGMKSCIWGEAPKTITVRFAEDTAVFFSSEGLKP